LQPLRLGSSVWGAGPSAAVVSSGGPWVAGVLVNNIFSLGGTRGPSGNSYSSFLTNPFVACNLDDGWYLLRAQHHGKLVIERNQVDGADRRRRWSGLFFGALPVDLSVNAYYNVVKPTVGARWQLSTQLTFVF